MAETFLLFAPFERWLEAHKWGPLPEGMRPMFREGYRTALRDVVESLRADGMESSARVIERGLARMDAAYPPLPEAAPPASVSGGRSHE